MSEPLSKERLEEYALLDVRSSKLALVSAKRHLLAEVERLREALRSALKMACTGAECCLYCDNDTDAEDGGHDPNCPYSVARAALGDKP